MALTVGSRIGPYEVVAPLGVGGMGEVFRARDSRLNRDVALKVLPDAFASNPERLARFRREAQVLAALNHPHIAAIYGFEEANPLTGSGQAAVQALVLELVEGPTLADIVSGSGLLAVGSGQNSGLSKSPGPRAQSRRGLPIDEALPIARQIADALEAAHEQGIVHRDLKPANIKITPDGIVKVLDFGLAKLNDPNGPNVSNGPNDLHASQSPTITSPAMPFDWRSGHPEQGRGVMTGVGTILGTAAYMSPEQARGREADQRSDVWGFGCVLYEMLTGRRAFGGDDVSDTMAAVLRAEPDWAALPKDTPPAIVRLLRWCLQKDRKQRAPDIAIARFEIDSVLHPAHDGTSGEKPRPRPRWKTLAATAGLVVVACAVTGFTVWSWLRPAPAPVTRFDIAPSTVAPFTVGPPGVNLAISPDGRQIVYHVRRGADALELRRFDQLDSRPIPGTEGARHPAFSPDGRSLAFVKDLKLHTLSLDTATSVALCDVFNVAGTSWLTDTDIVFAQSGVQGGLYRVSVAGGQPERVAAPDATIGELDYRWPDALPDGRGVVFTVRRSGESGAETVLAVRSLESGEQKVLVDGGSYPRYVSTGQLLYAQGGTIAAVGFDIGRYDVIGSPVPMQEGIVTKGDGVANYAVAGDGTLVYVPGISLAYLGRFVWKDRDGRLLGAAVDDVLEFPRYPRISPDGRRLAATLGPAVEGSIWIFDLASAGQPLKLTFKDHNLFPTWTPDGGRVVFTSNLEAERNLFGMPADASVLEPERLLTSDNPQNPMSWSPDGRWLLYTETAAQTRSDLWLMPVDGERKPQPWLQTMFFEGEARFSPDGRWVSYASDQTGSDEVWIRPFPGPGSPVRVSPNGGRDPVWSRNGKELFYQEGNKLMATEVAGTQAGLQISTPRMLFEGGFIGWQPNTHAPTTCPRTADSS